MKGNWSIFRPLIQRRSFIFRSSSPSLSKSIRTLILPPNSMPSQIVRNSLFAVSSIWASTEFNFSGTSLPNQRCFCSAAGDQSKLVVLKSDEEFNSALEKAQDGSLSSVFYFTAAWCGPCRFLSPVVGKLSEEYPNVTTYKVDIDESGLSSTISKLNIAAVPTLHFFKGGAKEAEMVGADLAKLKNLMEQLYK